jgi:hypothetical protein
LPIEGGLAFLLEERRGKMKKLQIILISLLLLWFGISGASGAVINLFDAFLNVDQIISIPGSLGPLGTVQLTINDPGNHFVGLFVDYEIDEATNTFFNEHGALSGGPNFQQSWEIDDPWNGDIFWNFKDSNYVVGSQLDNFNAVPAGMENDVSMALGWDFVLAAGETATIAFLISETMPESGFYLSHTDPDSAASIYFSSTKVVPIPSSLLLLVTGSLSILFIRLKIWLLPFNRFKNRA